MNDHPDGGTALVEHKELGFDSDMTTPERIEAWQRDTNDITKWNIITTCPMRFNRMFIADADLLHASLPNGGFGTSTKDGRLVMICFFDKE